MKQQLVDLSKLSDEELTEAMQVDGAFDDDGNQDWSDDGPGKRMRKWLLKKCRVRTTKAKPTWPAAACACMIDTEAP